MRTAIKSIIILFIIFQFAIYTNAENQLSATDSSQKIHIPSLAFSLDPLYTLQSGFRVDFEFRVAKNQWVIIGPQYFVATNKDMIFLGNDRNTDLEGYGVDIYHKVILKTEPSIVGPYAAYGVRYNVFNFSYQDQNSLGVWAPKEVTNTRYGFNVIFGYQNAINSKLLVDFYTGCGLQVSKLTGDDDGTLLNNSKFFMYNYSGPRFLLGFRIGLFLN